MFVPAQDILLADLYDIYRSLNFDLSYSSSFTFVRFTNYLRQQDIDLGQSLVAFSQGRLVAVALVGVRGFNRHLCSIAVSADHRGRGIATALVEHCLKAAAKAKLTLVVSPANKRALLLYDHLGFHTIGRYGFWYRGLPARLRPHQLVRPIDVDIAVKLCSRSPGHQPWPIQDRALTGLKQHLRGMVVLSDDSVRGIGIVSPGDIAGICRLSAGGLTELESMLRHVTISVPFARGLSLRWVREDEPLVQFLPDLGFVKYTEHQEMLWEC